MTGKEQPQISPEGHQPDAPKVLLGVRELGIVALPDGGIVSHELTEDGMKQVRLVRSTYPSAAHFHVARGVGTPGEIAKVDQMDAEAKAHLERMANAPVIDPHQKS